MLVDPAAAWDGPALTTHEFGNHAVRTEQWRYIRYRDGSEELYDKRADVYECTNLAGDPKYAKVKADLARALPTTEAPQRGSSER